MRLIIASERTIWGVLAVIRLINAMLIQTYFVPDEFWQSVEVAHKMVFKYPFYSYCGRVYLNCNYICTFTSLHISNSRFESTVKGIH